MVSEHTPGPWKLLKFEEDEHYCVTNARGTKGFHREIATVRFGYDEPAETEQHANARLMAAAPNFHSAAEIAIVELEAVEREIGIPSKALPLLRAAVARCR